MFFRANVPESLEHVLHRVRSMCIINDDRELVRPVESLQTPFRRFQSAELDQCLVTVCSHTYCSSVDGEKVVGIVLSDQSGPYFLAVDSELHPVESFFDNPASVVGDASAGIGHYLRLCILDHYHSVLVIDVGDGERV